MIGNAKSMIAGCIDRMRTEDCGNCERRDACSHLFSELFAWRAPERRPPPRGEAGPRDLAGSIFRTILGEVAKAVERSVEKARQEAASAPAPATAPPAASAPAEPPLSTEAGAKAETPSGPFAQEVERHLEPLLAAGPIGIASVARALGYSRQTLYRRLKAEGVTFEEVLDGLRRRLALRFIRAEGLSVKEAAWRLGFSDPAAFSRAFKRWTGAAPKAARRDH